MNANIPRYGQLKIEQRLEWLKDQILILCCIRHVKDVDPIDVLIDAMRLDSAIMENPDFRCLTQVEMQDAFKHGIMGEYGEFYGVTASSLAGFLRSYQKAEKWQKAKAIVYAKEKKEEEEKQRRFDKAMYEARLNGFKMPFWPSTRGKKRVVSQEESEAHRKKIEQQRQEILKDADL